MATTHTTRTDAGRGIEGRRRERSTAVAAHEPTQCRPVFAATAAWVLAAAVVATASTARATEPQDGRGAATARAVDFTRVSLAVFAAGVPVLVIGARQVSREEGRTSPPPARRNARAGASTTGRAARGRRAPAGPTRASSPALVTTGAVLMGSGATGVAVGAAMFASAGDGIHQDYALSITGGTLVVASGVAFLAGVPVLAVGAERVPLAESDHAALPTMRVGPASVDVSWRF